MNGVMFVMSLLVHNYSVITLDNWHLAYCDPTVSKDHKTVDCTAISINCMDAQSPFVFLFQIKICLG